MADCIVDPYGSEVCLPASYYDPIITYAKGGKKNRKHMRWLNSKLDLIGVPLKKADTVADADVVLKKNWDESKMNRKVFKALRSNGFDGVVTVSRSICTAENDYGELLIKRDASWFTHAEA